MGKFSLVDLFAGIGSFRLGLEKIGGVCIASSEIESKAKETYSINWPNDLTYGRYGKPADAKRQLKIIKKLNFSLNLG
jgi:site-specific DNA-cytosine methylase